MAGPSYPKLLFHLPPSSTMKYSSSSIIITSAKLKRIIHTFILSQLYRFARALANAKSLIIEVVNNFHVTHDMMQISIKKNTKNKNKLYVGSFRLHYNWCSSRRIMPEQVQIQPEADSSNWITWVYNNGEKGKEDQLSGYLDWLEHKTGDDEEEDSRLDPESEIDQLADLFIQNCHEKFRLEKIDSYRKFQEMMARSV